MRSPLSALIRKDLKGYFDQPTGYILIVIFVALLAYWFFRASLLNLETSLRPLFTVEFAVDQLSLPWLLALFVPAATMRLIAEEQRDGTLEILLTQPIRGWIVLLAKFAAAFIFVTVAILATLGIPIALGTAGDLDWGAAAAQYVGILFLAASFVSIGLFTSSLSRNQIVAFILGLFFIMLLMLVGVERVAVSLPTRLASVLQTLSPVTHFSSMARGVIDLRDIIYFIALVFTFLSATYLTIRAKSLSHRAVQYRNLQLGVAGLIVFSLLVGWFGNSIGGRLDLTADKLFTLSGETKKILSDLDDVMIIRLFESNNPPTQLTTVARDVKDFLRDFAAASDGKVKIVRKHPDKDEDVAREAELAGVPAVPYPLERGEIGFKPGYLGLDMTYVNRREVVPHISSLDGFEYRLASLANKMVQQERKTLGFLTGHGEKSKDQELRTLGAVLEQQYKVVEIPGSEDTAPDLEGVDVLVVPGPTREITEGEQEALAKYLDSGGKAMILVDSVIIDQRLGLIAIPNRNSFADFVGRYGVVVDDNLLFDVGSHETVPFTRAGRLVPQPYPYWMRVVIADTKVVGNVGTMVVPWASSVAFANEFVGRVEMLPLLQTTEFGAVHFGYRQDPDVSPTARTLSDVTEGDLVANFVGVAVIGPTSVGSIGSGEEPFRLVVMGDSEWLTDPLVTRYDENLAVALNLIDWLAQEETLATIRSKVVSPRPLQFESTNHRNTVRYANIIGVPMAFVVIGLLMYLRRRNTSLKVYGREG